MTTKGVSSLLDCKALEDLLLRHNVSFYDCFLSSYINVYCNWNMVYTPTI